MSRSTDEVVALLKTAIGQGRVVLVPDSLATRQHHIDRALTAAPLRSNDETALVVTCGLLFKLTHAEARTFVKLLKHDLVARAELHAAMAADDNPTTESNILNVVVFRLRRKLSPYGIQIDTIRGFGFKLADDARGTVRRLLAEYGEDILAAAAAPSTAAPP